MKESRLNISLQKCDSKQNEPSSPLGEETRWGLLSSVLAASNWEIATSQFHAIAGIVSRNDDNYEDLLKWN